MATRSQAFPSNYLGKDDVSSPITVTIDRVEAESVGQGAEAEEKRVAHFQEKVKPMILNSGNWQMIESISGEGDDEHWAGTRIEIFVDPTVSYGGKRIGGLRVREATAQRPAATPAADPVNTAAKIAAWNRWKEMNPGDSPAVLATKLTAATKRVFGLDPAKLTPKQWNQLVAQDFDVSLDQVAADVLGGEGVPWDDIPF